MYCLGGREDELLIGAVAILRPPERLLAILLASEEVNCLPMTTVACSFTRGNSESAFANQEGNP